MTLTPLLAATPVIQIHGVAPMAALVLGLVQFGLPKGTVGHRAIGWAWAATMLAVAVSSLFIHEIRLLGSWSPIHLLSVLTLVMLPAGLLYAHRHNVRGHRSTMVGLYVGGLVIAGLFTLVPGRIMSKVLLGG